MSLSKLVLPVTIFAALCTLSCATAGHRVGERFVVPERFSLRIPSPALWKMTRNIRMRDKCDILWHHRAIDASMRIQIQPVSREAQDHPLEMQGQLYFLRDVQLAGGRPELHAMAIIILDERRAVALVGRRHERPNQWGMTLIYTRSQGYEIMLEYMAPMEVFNQLAPEFEKLLRHFHIRLPSAFDPWIIDDRPMGAPGPFPFDARGNEHNAPLPSFRLPSQVLQF